MNILLKSLFLLTLLTCLSVHAADKPIALDSPASTRQHSTATEIFFTFYNTFRSFRSTHWKPEFANYILCYYWAAITSESNDGTIKKLITTLTDYALDQDPTETDYIIECATHIGQTPMNTPKHNPIKGLKKLSYSLIAEVAQRFAGEVAAYIIDHFNFQIMDKPLSNADLIDLVVILTEMGAEIDQKKICDDGKEPIALASDPARKDLFQHIAEQIANVFTYWTHTIPVVFDESEFAPSDEETPTAPITTRQKLLLDLQRKPIPCIILRSTTPPTPFEPKKR